MKVVVKTDSGGIAIIVGVVDGLVVEVAGELLLGGGTVDDLDGGERF